MPTQNKKISRKVAKIAKKDQNQDLKISLASLAALRETAFPV
jgi:hypothetical protein